MPEQLLLRSSWAPLKQGYQAQPCVLPLRMGSTPIAATSSINLRFYVNTLYLGFHDACEGGMMFVLFIFDF